MPPKRTRLSLSPIEKQLKQILVELERQAKRPSLTNVQKGTLAKDIKNVKSLIKSLPPNCHKEPSYDLGI